MSFGRCEICSMEILLSINFLTQLLCVILLICVTFLYWIHQHRDYFKNLGIPYIPSTPLLGSFKDTLFNKTGFYDQVVKLYNQPDVKGKSFFGIFIFHKPALMINDPELIKNITVKDFNSFCDRYTSSDVHDPVGHYTLFASNNPLWKRLRGKLSPFFTSGKLKTMYYLLDKITSEMVDFLHKNLDVNNKVELEVKELATLYTTDVIASCAFGVEANSLENPEGEFRVAGRTIFEAKSWRSVEFTAFFMLPQVMKLFRFKAFSESVSRFLQTTVTHVMEVREVNGIQRNDLIDTFIELKKEKNFGETLTMDMLVAQAAGFFSAGFETSSATLSFAMYEIAKNQNIQSKLRSEIKNTLLYTGGKVTYDTVMDIVKMPYLHQVVHETLRLYAILPMIERICVNPNGYSLEPFSEFKIPYGMPVFIPCYAIQRDEKYFANPLKFDPERFSKENIENIKPFTHLPFGTGNT